MNWRLFAVIPVAIVIGFVAGFPSKWGKGRTEKRPKYYQDSMHPWVKSDQPGLCPICSMDLSPIYDDRTNVLAAQGGKGRQTVSLSKEGVTVAHVQTEKVRRQTILKTLRVSGTIEPEESRTSMLSSPANARVDSIQVKHVGAWVNRGDPVVKLFSPDLAQRARFLRLASSNRTVGTGALPTNRRSEKPIPGGNPAMIHSGGSMENPVEAAPAAAPTGNDLFSTDLAAPSAGVVTERSVTLGQYLMEGQKILTVVDPSVVWFRFEVSPAHLDLIRIGQDIRVRGATASGREFSGSVALIEPLLDDQKRFVKIRAAITNRPSGASSHHGYELNLGTLVEGEVLIKVSDVVAVPRSAIIYPGHQAWAYVQTAEGTYERRRLKVGREGDRYWEVRSGLKEGELVVTSGNLLIDAQASLERGPDDMESAAEGSGAASGEASMSDEGHRSASHFKPTPAELAEVRKTLALVSKISESLAADDLAAFNKSVNALRSASSGIEAAMVSRPLITGMADLLSQTPAAASKDLKQAREAFLKFGESASKLVRTVKTAGAGAVPIHIYHCPMAPQPGLWISESAKIANPFFGKSMLRCGEEVMVDSQSGDENEAESQKEEPVKSPAAQLPSEDKRMTNAATGRPDEMAASKETGDRQSTNRNARPSGNTHAEASLSLMTARDEIKSQMRARAIAAAGGLKAPPAPTLTDSQSAVLRDFFDDTEKLGRLLAAGNWVGFDAETLKLERHFEPFLRQLAAPPKWGPVVEALRVLITFGPSENLEDARRRFAPFAQSSSTLLQEVVAIRPEFKSYGIYSGSGDSGNRRWIQSGDRSFDPYAGTNSAKAIRINL